MAWEWIGPVTTAVVGVAGVAGTVWTAHAARKHQIEVSKAQAALSIAVALAAEKRLVYAKFLRHAEVAFEEAQALRAGGRALRVDRGPLLPLVDESTVIVESMRESGTPFDQAMKELDLCHREVVISGGLEIGNQASELSLTLGRYASEVVEAETVSIVMMETTKIMHEDALRPAGPLVAGS